MLIPPLYQLIRIDIVCNIVILYLFIIAYIYILQEYIYNHKRQQTYKSIFIIVKDNKLTRV